MAIPANAQIRYFNPQTQQFQTLSGAQAMGLVGANPEGYFEVSLDGGATFGYMSGADIINQWSTPTGAPLLPSTTPQNQLPPQIAQSASTGGQTSVPPGTILSTSNGVDIAVNTSTGEIFDWNGSSWVSRSASTGGQTTTDQTSSQSTGAGFESPGAVNVTNTDWLIAQEEIAVRKYIADLQAQADAAANATNRYGIDVGAATSRYGIDVNAQLEADDQALRRYIADRQDQLARDLQSIEQEFLTKENGLDRKLQADLQAGRIDADKYMQTQALAHDALQRDRDRAIELISIAQRDVIDKAGIRLAALGELRAERELFSRLEANPGDIVQLEILKQMGPQGVKDVLGGFLAANQLAPEELAMQTGAVGGTLPMSADDMINQVLQGFNVAGGNVPENLLGVNYPDVGPAYGDEVLRNIAKSILDQASGRTGGALYNPNLQGTGYGGVEIPGPNEYTSAGLMNLDADQLAVINSFLNAGVEIAPGGPRVGISPNDYWAQVTRSLVPAAQATEMTAIG